MSKIVQAINAMIANSQYIANVQSVDIDDREEFFFEYKRYVWSIYRNEDGEYWVYYYPQAKSSNEVVGIVNYAHYPLVAYGDNDLRSREAVESASELFMLLKGKLYNVDSVLDDIIGDDFI